jgi:DNA mismatch endonuclease (patch repair protein)
MKPTDPTYPHPSSPLVTAVMQANRKLDSHPEVALRSYLHRLGLRFRKNPRIVLPSLSVRPDIVFPRHRVIVFVDGCFWHSCPDHGTHPKKNPAYWDAKLARNLDRDARVNAALREAGWSVVRVWEHQSPEEAATSIVAALGAGRI